MKNNIIYKSFLFSQQHIEDINAEKQYFLDIKSVLRNKIFTDAYKYSPDVPFKLVCGEISPFYFNCKKVLLTQIGMSLVGQIFYNEIKDDNVTAIGGLTLGADPIAMATSFFSWMKNKELNPFVVRKQSKNHGVSSMIEGVLNVGERVIVVDDVVTTGSSTIQAIQECLNFGLIVEKVVVLIDRMEFNGMNNIKKYVDNTTSIFNVKDFQ